MAPPKPRPSEIAAEAKRVYAPYIEQRLPQFPAKSYLHPDSSAIRLASIPNPVKRLRIAVIDGDPVDVALDWFEANKRATQAARVASSPPPECPRIPVVNMANEKRAGGDWESGLMAPEECLCRRSNLVQNLVTPWNPFGDTAHYPLPQTGGLYSPNVGMLYFITIRSYNLTNSQVPTVVYRSGPEFYNIWNEFRPLPVISVAPVRRPKVDDTGKHYSFQEEKNLMKEKMRTILRIAARWGHKDICLGAFGVIFRNPVAEVAGMWKDLLFFEPEFRGAFANVVFAIDQSQGDTAHGEFDCFKSVFDPASLFKNAFEFRSTMET
ncbi:MAG: hypothetical protein M1814_006870 [Vezdaea aestivalis]|nr:MAG: hypothetical protein M1814_006870 [Vezdaea aestivalis]